MSKELNAKKRIGLGRGLSALLDDNEAMKAHGEASMSLESMNLMEEIPLQQIETNPYQPRTHFESQALAELAESIKVQGIIQPITVRKMGPKKFQLISGERRLQASHLAGLSSIPAYVRQANDQQMIEMALIENIQRENLNAIEIAHSYKRLMEECDLKQEALGDRVGKSRSTVANFMRLLKLPPVIQVAIRDGQISMGHARCLVGLEDAEFQNKLFQEILDKELSVRQVEAAIRAEAQGQKSSPSPSKQPDAQAMQVYLQQLQGRFGKRVRLQLKSDGSGEFKVSFLSPEELEDMLRRLS